MSYISRPSLKKTVVMALVMAISTAAQNIQNPQSAVDNLIRSSLRVDPATGALQLQIPLAEFRGRGEASLPVVLYYSSKVWNIKHHSTSPCNGEPVTTYRPEYSKGSASGWTSSLGWFLPAQDLSLETYEGQTQKPAQQGNPTLNRIMRKYVTLPDGSRHELRLDDALHQGGPLAGRYYAVDGSRLWLDFTDSANNILFMPNGSRIVTANSAIQYFDRNGNFLTYNSGTWTDTLGRTIGVPIPGAAPVPGPPDPTYTLPGGMTYTMRWRNLTDARTDPSQPLQYPGDAPSANCTLGGAQPNTLFSTLDGNNKILQQSLHNPVVLWQIGLPNGTNYTFTYNVYGELNKIVYPTGGFETFGYGVKEPLGGQLDDGTYSQANRGITSRVVNDGVTSQPPWGYGGAPLGVTGVDPATAARAVTAPDGSVTVTWYYKSWGTNIKYGFDDARAGMEREERVYQTLGGPMLRRRLMNVVKDGPQAGGYSTATRNARVTKTVDIILDTGGNALAALTELTYDADLNVISTKRYGYVPIIQATAQTGDFASMPSLNSTLLRTEETDYLTNNQSYRDRNLLALPIAMRVKNGLGNIVAQSSISYDEATYPLLTCGAVTGWSDLGTTVRGNATTAANWFNTAGTYLQTHTQYDQCGSLRNVWDAKGNLSQVEYSSNYSYAYPTLTRTAVPDPTGQYGSTAPLVSTTTYDLATGLVTSKTDANNQTTSYTYTDPLNRIKTVTSPDGGLTTYNYSDSLGSLYVEMVTKQTATQSLYSYQFFDPLGRPNRSFLFVGSGNYMTSDTEYDSMGRISRVSNPYISTGSASTPNPSGNWTTSIYDKLGRVLSVTTPDGAVVNSKYSGSQVLVIDQASKKRMSQTDALGRMTDVWEITSADSATEAVTFPPDSAVTAGYRTKYAYDVLDNLLTVTQRQGTSGPLQTRSFVYDSLKRLTSAANPESGTISYQYDSNGNLTLKTDARGVTSTYIYDALNRNTNVNYSDSTPDILRQYDLAIINGKGRLNQAWQAGSTSSATYIDSYDAVGRPKIQRQRFETGGVWSSSFKTQRDYNLAGGVISQTYPSGRTINYSYDDAGRTLSFTGNLGDGVFRTYASAITYSAFGGKQQEQFGTQTPLFHKLHYNVRGQLYDIRLSTMSLQTNEWDWNRGALVNYFSSNYSWGGNSSGSGTDNNGNLTRSTAFVPLNDQISAFLALSDTYSYEQLNRLTSVSESNFSDWTTPPVTQFTQIFDYDRWGNRTISLATTNAPEPQFTASSATNRLGVPVGYTGRMDYDAAGNLVNDTYTSYGRTDGTPTRLYDAENRLTMAKDGNLVEVSSYSYNADGQRVRRKVSGVETWQVYGMDGELLTEYASGAATFVPTKEYGYRNGELLVTVTSGDDQRMKRFLQALYYGALQVDAPSQWMTDKSNELAAAGATSQAQLLVKAKEIARALFAQTNYETNPSRTDTQYVTDLYYAYLQRGPDTGGLGWWVSQAAGSVQNRINVLNAFEASGEFQTLVNTLFGTATSDGQRTENYVTNFYQGALSRPPDSTELTTNTTTLNNAAAQGQSQVISAAETMGRNLFAPQVNDASLSNTQYVTNLYEGFLQRGPDAGGLSWWAGQASVGQGRQNVLNAFAASSAFRELAGTLYREAYWLVADHLGTPRMVVNKSGSLSSVKRHDYLPFGEELGLISGRTTVMGYSSNDTVRQKFTSKERDNETNLDYFLARYYSSTQGRFTSSDPILIAEQKLFDPQQWNMYSYARNNPVVLTDPTGQYVCADAKKCAQFEKTRQEALKSKDADTVRGASAYGDLSTKKGDKGDNGVYVSFAADLKDDRGGSVTRRDTGIELDSNSPNGLRATLNVTIKSDLAGDEEVVAHEGSHVADYQDFVKAISPDGTVNKNADALNITHRQTETRAYLVSIGYAQRGNKTLNFGPCGMTKECKFAPGMMPALRDKQIQDLLNSQYKNLDTRLWPEQSYKMQP